MKRTIAIILIMMIIGIQTTIYAADPSYRIELVPNKTNITLGEEVEIILKVKDFENVTSGLYGYDAIIEYDKNIFEELPYDSEDHISENLIGEEKWDIPTFNPENGKIVGTTSKGVKAESNVLKIKLKVKSNAVIGAKPQIKITNFEASDADNIIKAKADAVVSLNVVAKNNESDNSNQGSNNEGTSGTNNNNPDSNNEGTSGTNNNNPSGTNGGTNGTNNSNPSGTNGGTSGTNNSNPSATNGGASGTSNKNPSTITPQNGSTNDISNKKLPQTGETDWIYVAGIAVVIIIGAVSYIKYKRTY